jgi:hypothetical protein
MSNPISNVVNRLALIAGYVPSSERQLGAGTSPYARELGYQVRDSLLSNTIYLPVARGGMLEKILDYDLGLGDYDIEKTPVIGAFNPSARSSISTVTSGLARGAMECLSRPSSTGRTSTPACSHPAPTS